jgi:hypothetical protein
MRALTIKTNELCEQSRELRQLSRELIEYSKERAFSRSEAESN